MPLRSPVSHAPRRHSTSWEGPQFMLAALALAGSAAAATLIATWPAPLVLPALSVLFVLAAASVAALAWTRRVSASAPARVSWWDISGALAFLGICAALLSDPEQAMPLLEQRIRN